MNLLRFSLLLAFLGVGFLAGGLTIWASRMPEAADFRVGYHQCLWSFYYEMPMTSVIVKWQAWGLIKPGWDHANVECKTAKDQGRRDYVREAEISSSLIMTGVAPKTISSTTAPFEPPILNGVGVFLLAFGALIFFSRATPARSHG